MYFKNIYIPKRKSSHEFLYRTCVKHTRIKKGNKKKEGEGKEIDSQVVT